MITKQEQKFDADQKAKEVKEAKKAYKPVDVNEESLIRILGTDIPGSKSLYVGLTRIKGVSWSFCNAICHVLKLDKNKKISELSPHEIEIISNFIKNPKLPDYILNRRKDLENSKTEHLTGADLDMRREFDIKRLKKIKAYKGVRHATGQPVRGQRTKSHFRKNKTIGVQKKAKAGKKG